MSSAGSGHAMARGVVGRACRVFDWGANYAGMVVATFPHRTAAARRGIKHQPQLPLSPPCPFPLQVASSDKVGAQGFDADVYRKAREENAQNMLASKQRAYGGNGVFQ